MNRQQSCPTMHTHKYIISQIEALQKKKKQIKLLLKDQPHKLSRIQLINEGLNQIKEKSTKIAKEIKKLEEKVMVKEKETIVNEEKLVQLQRQRERIQREIEGKCMEIRRPQQHSQSQILMRLMQCQDEVDKLLQQHSKTILPLSTAQYSPHTFRSYLIQFYLNYNTISPVVAHCPNHCLIHSQFKARRSINNWRQLLFQQTQKISQNHHLINFEMDAQILNIFKGCSLFGLEGGGECGDGKDGVQRQVGLGLDNVCSSFDMVGLDYSCQSLHQSYQEYQVHCQCQSNHQKLMILISNDKALSIANYIAQHNLIQRLQQFITTQFTFPNHTNTQLQIKLQISFQNYINCLKQLQTFLTYKQDLQLYSPYETFTAHLQQLLSYQSQLSIILSNIQKQSLYLTNLISQTQLLKLTLEQLRKQDKMIQIKKQQLEKQLYSVQKRFMTFEEMKHMDLNQIDDAIRFLKQKRQSNASTLVANGQLGKQNIQFKPKPSQLITNTSNMLPSQQLNTLTHVPSKAFTSSTHNTVTSIPCPDFNLNSKNYCFIDSYHQNNKKHHKQNSFAQQLDKNYNQGTTVTMQNNEQLDSKQNLKPSSQKHISLDKKVQSSFGMRSKQSFKSCIKSNSMKNLTIKPQIKSKPTDEQLLTVGSPKCSIVKRKSSTTKPALQLKRTVLKSSNWK